MALTAKDIQDKADSIIAPLISSIDSFQATWVQTHKGYWQGIRTPQAIPQDGADTAPDKTLKPVLDAEAKAWNEVSITVPTTVPCSVEVFTHDGPGGKGYSVIATVQFGTQKFRRSAGRGSYSIDSGGAWQEILPPKA